MDLTQGTDQEKRIRSRKMMLWFGIISMAMMFAGLTSAFVVSRNREDWVSFDLPQAFLWSTLVIIISSISLVLAKRAIRSGNRSAASGLMLLTLGLGIVFIYLQFEGFGQIINQGYYFTGSASTVTSSFIYLLVLAHIVHIAAGLIVLLVLIYNHFKQRYKPGQMLGLELGATFWHFVDFLWLYLYLFLYFFK